MINNYSDQTDRQCLCRQSLQITSCALSRLAPYTWSLLVAGMEVLSCSRDLLPLPSDGCSRGCYSIGRRRIHKHKVGRETLRDTSRPCEHGILQTLQRQVVVLLQTLRFTTARKRRQRNRPYLIRLCPTTAVKNSSKCLAVAEPAA